MPELVFDREGLKKALENESYGYEAGDGTPVAVVGLEEVEQDSDVTNKAAFNAMLDRAVAKFIRIAKAHVRIVTRPDAFNEADMLRDLQDRGLLFDGHDYYETTLQEILDLMARHRRGAEEDTQ